MKGLEFKIEGPIAEDGIPIHLAINALDNFQSIIDKTYLVAAGSQRMTAKERESFQVKAKYFKIGSFITDFEICLYGVQLVLPFISTFGPQNVWEYTKETFMFLKLVCAAIHSDKKPTYEFNENRDFTVHTGDIHQHFNGPVFLIGEKALPNYQNLAHLLEPGKVEVISAGSQGSPEIKLDLNDRTLFDFPINLVDQPYEIECEIFDFNKFKNNGRLRVNDGQGIPPGDYSFSIFGSQDNVNYIYSMLKPLVTIECLVEVGVNPFEREKIVHLQITGIRP